MVLKGTVTFEITVPDDVDFDHSHEDDLYVLKMGDKEFRPFMLIEMNDNGTIKDLISQDDLASENIVNLSYIDTYFEEVVL